MDLEVSGEIICFENDLYVVTDRPDFFYGAMMRPWLSYLSGPPIKTTAHDVGDKITLLIPRSIAASHRLAAGMHFAAILSFPDFKRLRNLPDDLAEVLLEKGVDLDSLTGAERRQALLFLAESSEPGVRRERIMAIVGACRRSED